MVFPNTAKLALVVLGFFLALTFVRAISVDTDVKEVVFDGEAPFEFTFSITNTLSTGQKPSLMVDGPFTLLLSEEDAAAIIPGNETKIYHAKLVPAPALKVGDVYHSQIRVIFSSDEVIIPLTVTKKNPSLFSPGLGTGLVSFTSAPWVDALLILIILILAVALVARIRNRILGGKQ